MHVRRMPISEQCGAVHTVSLMLYVGLFWNKRGPDVCARQLNNLDLLATPCEAGALNSSLQDGIIGVCARMCVRVRACACVCVERYKMTCI